MQRVSGVFTLAIAALVFPGLAPSALAQGMANCAQLLGEASPGIRITSAEVVAAGTFAPPNQPALGGPPSAAGGRDGGAAPTARAGGPAAGARGGAQAARGVGAAGGGQGLGRNGGRPGARYAELPAFCKVTATLVPTPTSDIRAELWLPLSGWNGNFVGSSPNAMGGNIPYGSMANALRDGYAVMGEDTGHRANEPNWMDDQDRRIDFGHRAIHEATVFAKALITKFYERAPRYSYMRECGGATTAALAAVQNYPADYDGVIAGAYPAYWTRQTFGQMWPWYATHLNPASTIPTPKFSMIHDAVLNACDGLDGVRDRVLEDPRRCTWDPQEIACRGGIDGPSCLTPPQVEAVRKVYAGPTNPRTGEKIHSPLYRGSELNWGGLLGADITRATGPFLMFFRSFVFKDATWDFVARPLDFDTDVARANTPDITVINANKPDISQFVNRGGKLILSNGWSNAIVPPGATVDYFNDVRAAIGERAAQAGVRLYMVPDMSECSGGAGTDTFDMMGALQRWVEQGQAPSAIPASRVEPDGRVSRTRPLCPYPQVATYSGTGSTDDARNFSCQAPTP